MKAIFDLIQQDKNIDCKFKEILLKIQNDLTNQK